MQGRPLQRAALSKCHSAVHHATKYALHNCLCDEMERGVKLTLRIKILLQLQSLFILFIFRLNVVVIMVILKVL